MLVFGTHPAIVLHTLIKRLLNLVVLIGSSMDLILILSLKIPKFFLLFFKICLWVCQHSFRLLKLLQNVLWFLFLFTTFLLEFTHQFLVEINRFYKDIDLLGQLFFSFFKFLSGFFHLFMELHFSILNFTDFSFQGELEFLSHLIFYLELLLWKKIKLLILGTLSFYLFMAFL